MGGHFYSEYLKKVTVVLFYSTLSPQKWTKLNTEKHHAQGAKQ